jgi:hypothetical protein
MIVIEEHTELFLELAAAFGPMFLVIFGGIIAIYTRLARIETQLGPVWKDFISRREEN